MSPPAGALGVLADPALVGLVVGGNDAAFEALDRRHRPAVLRQCACLLRSPHDAEEATQQAMFKAYRALDRGAAPTSFLPWLMTIARNECFNMIRARKGVESLSTEVVAGGDTPTEHVERRERVAILKEDLVELPDAQRRALVLRGVGDLSHAEIARILGGTPMEMRTLVHEARISLAEFEAGRELDCAVVRERIDTGDGRALRARRVRAHLRACESCSLAAGRMRGSRRGVASFLPFPIFGAIRAALFGGGPAGVAGPAGVVGVSAAVVAAVVIGFGGGTGGGAVALDRVSGGSAPRGALVAGVSAPGLGTSGSTRARTTTRPRTIAATPTTEPGATSAAPAAGTTAPSAPGSEGESSAPATTTPAVSTPSVPGVPATPSLSTPAVKVPPVSAGPVSVPSVSVPSVSVPSVCAPGDHTGCSPHRLRSTPQVTTPPIATPTVTTPPVSTPAIVVPPVTVPTVVVAPPEPVLP